MSGALRAPQNSPASDGHFPESHPGEARTPSPPVLHLRDGSPTIRPLTPHLPRMLLTRDGEQWISTTRAMQSGSGTADYFCYWIFGYFTFLAAPRAEVRPSPRPAAPDDPQDAVPVTVAIRQVDAAPQIEAGPPMPRTPPRGHAPLVNDFPILSSRLTAGHAPRASTQHPAMAPRVARTALPLALTEHLNKDVILYKELMSGTSRDPRAPSSQYSPSVVLPHIAVEVNMIVGIVESFRDVIARHRLTHRETLTSFDFLIEEARESRLDTPRSVGEISKILSYRRKFERFRMLTKMIAIWCQRFPSTQTGGQPLIYPRPGGAAAFSGTAHALAMRPHAPPHAVQHQTQLGAAEQRPVQQLPQLSTVQRASTMQPGVTSQHNPAQHYGLPRDSSHAQPSSEPPQPHIAQSMPLAGAMVTPHDQLLSDERHIQLIQMLYNHLMTCPLLNNRN